MTDRCTVVRLARADVVLTTYNIVSKEVGITEDMKTNKRAHEMPATDAVRLIDIAHILCFEAVTGRLHNDWLTNYTSCCLGQIVGLCFQCFTSELPYSDSEQICLGQCGFRKMSAAKIQAIKIQTLRK